MAKQFAFSDSGRQSLSRGIEQLANAARITYGPKGRTVALLDAAGKATLTTDGVKVANAVDLPDRLENLGAQVLKEAAATTADNVGDGTTTAIILAQRIFQEGLLCLSSGAEAMALKRAINQAVDQVLSHVRSSSREAGPAEIAAMSAMFSGDDPSIGESILEAFRLTGNRGIITVEQSNTGATYVKTAAGMSFGNGYLSPYFVTNAESMEAVLEDPYVLIFEGKISSAKEMLSLLESVARSGKPLLIVADSVEGEALATLVVNHLRGTLKACAVAAPGVGESRQNKLADIATLTCGMAVMRDTGMTLDHLQLEALGSARRVTVTKDDTLIVAADLGRKAMEARVRQLRMQMERAPAGAARDAMQARLAALPGNVAVIHVGANTELELSQKRLRTENALKSVQAAIEEGVVTGGGVALLRAGTALDGPSGDIHARFADRIVRRACQEPLRQIAANAGYSGAFVAERVRDQRNPHAGFNAVSNRLEDLQSAGILDATKVTCSALVNATSVAGMALTTEAIVSHLSDIPPRPADLDQTVRAFDAPAFLGAQLEVLEEAPDLHFQLDHDVSPLLPLRLKNLPKQPLPLETAPEGSPALLPPPAPGPDGGDGGSSTKGGGGQDRPGSRPAYKAINIWLDDRDLDAATPLIVDTAYLLDFQVGDAVAKSLVDTKDARIPQSDIPDEGLDTEWEVSSATVALEAVGDHVTVSSEDFHGSPLWTAQFALHIPKKGETDVRQLRIRPLTEKSPGLEVLVYARGALYRKLVVRFMAERGRNIRVDQAIRGPASQLFLSPDLEFIVNGPGRARLVPKRAGKPDSRHNVDWPGDGSTLANPIDNLREALETFQENHHAYLSAIDPADLAGRLANPDSNSAPDPQHRQLWEAVASSDHLRRVASYGHELFEAMFSPDARRWIATLPEGALLSIDWPDKQSGAVHNTPWGLMYPEQVKSTQPVDPTKFFGLRYRLHYHAHDVAEPTWVDIGNSGRMHWGCCLFWGKQIQDEVEQQRDFWKQWRNGTVIPKQAGLPNPKMDLHQLLSEPPRPMPLLYLYCLCGDIERTDPILQFGDTNQSSDVFEYWQLDEMQLPDQPLVFLNACATSAPHALTPNPLEKRFFDKGCRAFIGTECKVPAALGSRFAVVFCHFFFGKIDGRRMNAGEAFFQTRRFLWERYHNIGGLLYTHVNDYDLFVSDEDTVASGGGNGV